MPHIYKTDQEVFNAICQHLALQGRRSRKRIQKNGNRSVICAYRGRDGCKCAAGFLIPDDKYDPKMEGNSIFHLPVRNTLQISNNVSADLIRDLQTIHDGEFGIFEFYMNFESGMPEELLVYVYWPVWMRVVARKRGLKIPPAVKSLERMRPEKYSDHHLLKFAREIWLLPAS